MRKYQAIGGGILVASALAAIALIAGCNNQKLEPGIREAERLFAAGDSYHATCAALKNDSMAEELPFFQSAAYTVSPQADRNNRVLQTCGPVYKRVEGQKLAESDSSEARAQRFTGIVNKLYSHYDSLGMDETQARNAVRRDLGKKGLKKLVSNAKDALGENEFFVVTEGIDFYNAKQKAAEP